MKAKDKLNRKEQRTLRTFRVFYWIEIGMEGSIMEYTRFWEELRELRTRRHQNQQEMADILGVTKSFLSMVEKKKEGRSGEMGQYSDRALSPEAIFEAAADRCG